MAQQVTPNLDRDTLTGDIRDFILTWIRSMQKPFEQMDESAQMDVIDAAETAARSLVGGAISVISGGGFEKAFVKLGQFTVKEGIEAKLVTARTERNLLNFNDFAGRSAMLIFADPQEFDGARGPARVFRKQRDIEEVLAEKKPEPVTPATPANPPQANTPDEHRLNDYETVDPTTGEITTTQGKPEIKGDLKNPATGKTLNAATDEIGELPENLKRPKKAAAVKPTKVAAPAPPGTIDKDDPGEPTEVTINDAAPVVTRHSERDPFDDEPGAP